MKKWMSIALIATVITCFSGIQVLAQDQSEDQKTQAALKRQAELKRQIREEIEKQNRILEAELNRLRQENTAPATSAGALKASKASTNVAHPNAAVSNDSVADDSALGSNVGNNGNSTNILNPGGRNLVDPTTPGTALVAPQAGSSPINGNCLTVFLNTQKPSRLDQAKCYLARAMVRDPTDSGIDLTSESETYFLMVLLGQLARSGKANVSADAKAFVLDVEASRNDKQLGADPKSSGTTSLAVKGGIPTVLSWAVENGAAVASSSGTGYTFRINPVGLAQALASSGYITGYQKTENDSVASFLRKTSVGFTFDTTRGTNPPTLIGSKQQLSAVSFRYNFINDRDPRATQYQKLWDGFFEKEGLALTLEQSDQLKALEDPDAPPIAPAFKNKALQKWVETTNAAYRAQAAGLRGAQPSDVTDKLVAFIDQSLSSLPIDRLGADPDVVNALNKIAEAYLPYLKAKKKILDEVAKGTLATFEYTNFREPNAPDLSSFRFIMEKGTLGGVDLTANASLTLFNKRPAGPNVQRVRDFDFSAQLDKKLPDFGGLGPSTLSFTGKFQRLTSNAVAFDGTVLPNTKGDIAAGQIKLMIPLKDTGIKIPFSITFANRTELVREKEVRGNFGFTFDLDTLFAKFKPF